MDGIFLMVYSSKIKEVCAILIVIRSLNDE